MREDPRTAVVHLRFTYRVAPGTIALDEIINRIVVETLTLTGEAVGRIAVDPNDVNLKPERVLASYRLTIYRPEGDYRPARARVRQLRIAVLQCPLPSGCDSLSRHSRAARRGACALG
jgi:hypothetical protein